MSRSEIPGFLLGQPCFDGLLDIIVTEPIEGDMTEHITTVIATEVEIPFMLSVEVMHEISVMVSAEMRRLVAAGWLKRGLHGGWIYEGSRS